MADDEDFAGADAAALLSLLSPPLLRADALARSAFFSACSLRICSAWGGDSAGPAPAPAPAPAPEEEDEPPPPEEDVRRMMGKSLPPARESRWSR